jgi:creatinine deaminase
MPEYGRIVVAVDDSEAGKRAFAAALALAKKLGSHLLVVSVVQDLVRTAGENMGEVGERYQHARPHFEWLPRPMLERAQQDEVVVSPKTMDKHLRAAIEEAQLGLAEHGIPIGSVIVHDGKVIGRGHNRRDQKKSAILHGEMDALENAGRQPAAVFKACVLYTTLSPCSMYSGAIVLYGIPKVVVGENRTFMGAEDWLRSRGVLFDVLEDETCIRMMERFIRENPSLWNEDIGVGEP